MAMPDIPMYVFTGFLESGKTKFIQETLEDERFNPISLRRSSTDV